MKVDNFTHALLRVSEKAANIARAIRANDNLLSLLVQEKDDSEKNPKFLHDFKTLADVLIQEVIKHELSFLFPCLKGWIFGEESNTFVSASGSIVTIRVCDTADETAALLTDILQGDSSSGQALAAAVHQDVDVNFPLPLQDIASVEIGDDSIALWIDPIDSTEQFIQGIETAVPTSGIYPTGLQCVAVLVGAYGRLSGQPIVGAAIRPFHSQLPDRRWTGLTVCGLSYGDLAISNACVSSEMQRDLSLHRPRVAVLSRSELGTDAHARLVRRGWQCVAASGAGNKMLAVIEGAADMYFSCSGSVYEWDTCGPHAVLRSLGGGLIDYGAAAEAVAGHRSSDQAAVVTSGLLLSTFPFEAYEITYKCKASGSESGKYALATGLVAYRDRTVLEAFFRDVLSIDDGVQ